MVNSPEISKVLEQRGLAGFVVVVAAPQHILQIYLGLGKGLPWGKSRLAGSGGLV